MRLLYALPLLLLTTTLLPQAGGQVGAAPGRLIVIGFMGGNVRAGNLVHREALVARDLQQRFPLDLHAAVFANHDGQNALETVLQLLDAGGNRSEERRVGKE